MKFLATIVVTIAGLATLGVGYAMWSVSLPIDTTVKTGHIGLDFTGFSCSDIPGQPDLGQTKDVASTECVLVDTDGDGGHDTLRVTVSDAYPGFQMMLSNITIQGHGTVPVHITDTSFVFDGGGGALVMGLEGFWTDSNLVCLQVHAGDVITGDFWLHMSVEQVALENHTYTFDIAIDYAQWNETDCAPEDEDRGGTPGFWCNWDKHNTYTEAEILGWLAAINAASDWLGPITIADLEVFCRCFKGHGDDGSSDDFSSDDYYDDGSSDDISSDDDSSDDGGSDDGGPCTMGVKFRLHYLATLLNIESGRLAPSGVHDFSTLDPTDYLGLGGSATLALIVDAMEGKFSLLLSPTDAQFEIMKDILDALNNLEI